jgi:hypothetical protein
MLGNVKERPSSAIRRGCVGNQSIICVDCNPGEGVDCSCDLNEIEVHQLDPVADTFEQFTNLDTGSEVEFLSRSPPPDSVEEVLATM